MSQHRRLFFIDLLRIISLILVFSYHVWVHFQAGNFPINNYFPISIGGYSLGAIAVSCFIIISGFSLYYNYKDQLKPLEFIKTSLYKLYLPYWIYFFIFATERILRQGALDYRNLFYLIFSFTGLDSFYDSFFPGYTRPLTDWFLGFILIIYLLAPFIFKFYQHMRSANQALLLTGFFPLLIFLSLTQTPWIDVAIHFPLIRIFEFTIGIYLADYFFRHEHIFTAPPLWYYTIPLLLIIRFIFPISNPIANWLGICLILIPIFHLGYFLEKKVFIKIPSYIAKLVYQLASLSYIFFLCHNRIIYYYSLTRPQLWSQLPYNLYLEMLILFIVIIGLSFLIAQISNYYQKLMRQKSEFTKLQIN